jgi:hypothetical protein
LYDALAITDGFRSFLVDLIEFPAQKAVLAAGVCRIEPP